MPVNGRGSLWTSPQPTVKAASSSDIEPPQSLFFWLLVRTTDLNHVSNTYLPKVALDGLDADHD